MGGWAPEAPLPPGYAYATWALWPNIYSYSYLFSWQKKILRGISSSGLLFTAKILLDAMYLTSLYTWAKSLTKFNPKMQGFKRVSDFPIFSVKAGLNKSIFSIGFQTLKILFFLMALNTCGVLVIQWYYNSLFFEKNCPASMGFASRPSSVICLRYPSLLTDVYQFRHFHLLTLVN